MNQEKTYIQAINEGLDQALQLSSQVMVMGQLVNFKPGVFGMTSGLVQKHGKERVIDFPVAENMMTACALGAAVSGLRPVVVHQRIDFMVYAMDQIANWLSLWRFKSNGTQSVPVTIIAAVGKGWGQGPQHSKSMHAWFAHLPGLQVLMPATAFDAKGLLLESIFSQNPTLILLGRSLFTMKEEIPEEPYRVRVGRAKIRKEGKDITLVTCGMTVPVGLRAANLIEKSGIDAEVIDLRSITPLDNDSLIKSVSKTGRLAVIDYGWKSSGFASEVMASIVETGIQLKAPPIRLTCPDSHTPVSVHLENSYYPNEIDVQKAILKLFNR